MTGTLTDSPLVTVQNGAAPVVCVFANTLTLALQQAGSTANASLLKGLNAVVSLKSCKDLQALTIRIYDQQLDLSTGVSPDAQLLVTMDFDEPDKTPEVIGAWRHPILALRISRLLSLPLPDWTITASRFWQLTWQEPFMPGRLVLTCSDTAQSLSFGDGTPRLEIIGNADSLSSLTAGNSVLAQEAMAGRLKIRGQLQHVAGVSGAGLKLMLREVSQS